MSSTKMISARTWSFYSPLILLVSVLGATLLTACQPTVIIQKKPTEVIGIPAAALQKDQFQFGIPSGSADVLFVVDNSETGRAVEGLYSHLVPGVAERLESHDFRLVDFRLGVVTTPHNRSPVNFQKSGADHDISKACQYFELFGSQRDSCPIWNSLPEHHILSQVPERGDIAPLRALESALAHPQFKNRDGVPLFVVFVPARDQIGTFDNTALKAVLKSKRSLLKVFPFVLSKHPGEGCEDIIGRSLSSSPLFHRDLEVLLEGRTPHYHNLCKTYSPSPTGRGGLAIDTGAVVDDVMQSLAQEKSRLVLSRAPYAPEVMVVKSATRRYLYGVDYTFDPATNEIHFINLYGLERGDLIEVAYWNSRPGGTPDGQTPPIPQN